MKPDVFEARMRKGEYFHSLRVPDGMWAVLRMDGQGFTKLTKECGFVKPFSPLFNNHMVRTAQRCMERFQGVFATTHSDEISILLSPTMDMFDREVEKLVSSSASLASVAFSSILGEEATFDSRVWIGASITDVVDYFSWRMEDALRGAINSYAYWYLRQERNMSKGQATKMLMNKGFSWKNEFLFSEFGINFNDVPAWTRRGTGFYWKMVEKRGYNPQKNEEVKTLRRVLQVEDQLPIKKQLREFLSSNLGLLQAYPELRGSFNTATDHWISRVELEV